jgi:3-isopropylmalate/(R)-2-methylmalate dehydratase small subunit
VLIVGPESFGCGSSREHAPQSLLRRGFRAFVGGSFAEIFAGNCTALGLPCLVLDLDELTSLMDAVEARPDQVVTVDVVARTVTCDAGTFAAQIPDGTREQLLEGSWNATAVLADAGDAIEQTAERLPYVSAFREARP